MPRLHGRSQHPVSFFIEAGPFFKHNSHTPENLFKVFYFIHIVDNLHTVFMCQFTIFSHARLLESPGRTIACMAENSFTMFYFIYITHEPLVAAAAGVRPNTRALRVNVQV